MHIVNSKDKYLHVIEKQNIASTPLMQAFIIAILHNNL